MNKKYKDFILNVVSFIFPVCFGILYSVYLESVKTVFIISYPVNHLISALIAILSHFLFQWHIFKLDFKNFQKDFEYKINAVNKITSLMDEYAEANYIIDELLKSVKADLSFNKEMVISKKKKNIEFHSYLSRMKYKDYFQSHFIFYANEKLIKKIPKNYFENPIWARLVGESKCYLSTQVIDNDTKDLYLSDINRRNWEIARIKAKIEQGTLLVFNKLFIINDDLIDMNHNQVLDNVLFAYLSCWLKGFNISSDIQLKIIKFSQANGAIGPEKVKDMGIFDKILAFQTIDKNDELESQAFQPAIGRERAFTFEFNLDSSVTQEYRRDFETIFKQADDLRSYSVAVIS